MQNQNDLAINLMNLFEPNSYKEFSEGFFVNQPKMSGFYYSFKNMQKPKICLIVNLSGIKYPSTMVKVKDYVFIVLNVPSIEGYMNNFAEVYFPQIMEIIDHAIEKKSTRNLPYGYFVDENGEVQIDRRAASEVRRIYNLYIDTRSIRHIAQQLRTNFSDIREILHDSEEYLQMHPSIMSPQKLREVAELMAQNVRGGTVAKMSLTDEIAAARRRKKEIQRRSQPN